MATKVDGRGGPTELTIGKTLGFAVTA